MRVKAGRKGGQSRRSQHLLQCKQGKFGSPCRLEVTRWRPTPGNPCNRAGSRASLTAARVPHTSETSFHANSAGIHSRRATSSRRHPASPQPRARSVHEPAGARPRGPDDGQAATRAFSKHTCEASRDLRIQHQMTCSPTNSSGLWCRWSQAPDVCLRPTSTNARSESCASALLAKESRCQKVLAAKALLLADKRGHDGSSLWPLSRTSPQAGPRERALGLSSCLCKPFGASVAELGDLRDATPQR